MLPVPTVAYLLLSRGPLDRAGLEQAFGAALETLEGGTVHLPRGQREYAVDFGLRTLLERGIAEESEAGYRITEDGRTLAEYYAASIAHLFPREGSVAQLSAPAGS